MRVEYPHQLPVRGASRGDTHLTFRVYLERHDEGVSATLDVRTVGEHSAKNPLTTARGSEERDAMRKLSTYLRRVADVIDSDLPRLRLPAAANELPTGTEEEP